MTTPELKKALSAEALTGFECLKRGDKRGWAESEKRWRQLYADLNSRQMGFLSPSLYDKHAMERMKIAGVGA